ncbi:TLC domain-containing protein [Capsicum galapagoense]
MELPILFSSIPNLLSFFIFFFVIYIIAYFLIFPSWKPNLRPEASSCIISFFHGTPAVVFAITSLLSDPHRNFHSPNTPFQNMVLDYSIAYFLMDLAHYLVFYPSDVLFIGHHVATLFVFVTCRYVVYHGAYAILVLLILAEVTSFVQNTWTLANARKGDVEFAAKVYAVLSPPFYGFYSLVRGIAGPYFVYRMLSYYVSGAADSVIPRWAWISWVFVVVTAITVSIMWVSNLWVQLYRDMNRKFDKKVR